MDKNLAVTCSIIAAKQMVDQFENQSSEKWSVLYLNHEGKPVEVRDVEGGFESTAAGLKQITRIALDNDCLGIVIAHNHIGRSVVPDNKDVVITALLRDVLRNFNISLMDHLVLDGKASTYYSFADESIVNLETGEVY